MSDISSNQFKLMRIVFGEEVNVAFNYQELKEITYCLEARVKRLKRINAKKSYIKFVSALKENMDKIVDNY